MKRTSTIFFAILIISISICLSGCEKTIAKNLIFTNGSMSEPVHSIPSWVEESNVPIVPTENGNIHLVIDAGKSMEGFLARPGTYFDYFLGSLPSVCKNSFESIKVKSYRLLDDVYEICSPGDNYVAVGEDYINLLTDEQFFGTRYYNRYPYYRQENCDVSKTDYSSFIEFAIEEMKNPEDVVIFVTDFIPDSEKDPNLFEFNSFLCKDFFDEGYTIALVGIKNYYDGEISGISDGSEDSRYIQVDYKGNLPFYILILGNEGNVLQIMEEIKDTVEYLGIEDEKYNIYIANNQLPRNYGTGDTFDLKWENENSSKYIEQIENEYVVSQQVVNTEFFSDAVSYDVLPIDTYFADYNQLCGQIDYVLPYEISKAALFNFGEEWIIDVEVEVISGEQAVPDKSIEELNDTKIEGLVFPLDMRLDEYIYVYGQEEAEIENRENIAGQLMEFWDGRRLEFYMTYEPPEVKTSEVFFDLGDSFVTDNVISIPFTISLEKMDINMPYCVSISLSATPNIISRRDEQWIKDWSMYIDDIEDIIDDSSLYTGETTLNLEALSNFRCIRLETEPFISQQTYIFVKSESFVADETLGKFHEEVEKRIEEERQRKEQELQEEAEIISQGE